MKVLFINPPIRLSDKPRHIPHGLAILANIIRKMRGFKVDFLDLNALRYSDKETISILKSLEYDVVCIGGLIPVYKRIRYLSKIIKGFGDVPVIAGGSAVMSIPEVVLMNTDVDIICDGEGEKTLVEILLALRDGNRDGLRDVKGIYYRYGDEIKKTPPRPLIDDLDRESDLPAYNLLPMEIYLQNPVVGIGHDIDFITSRGCPFQCTFCYQPWGRRFRGHSVDFIIDALKYLKRKYSIDFISFQDDEFMTIKKRGLEFCERILREDLKLKWSCTGRVNITKKDILQTMKEAGCVAVSYGIESGSQEILNSMKKGVTVEQAENAIRINREVGIRCPTSFIIGMPDETDKTCQETVAFCIRNNINLSSLMFATPYPGTELFNYCLEKGLILQDGIHDFVMKLEDARDFVINLTSHFSDDALIKKREDMIREVKDNIIPPSIEKIEKMNYDLYGELYLRYKEQLTDESFLKHRELHGFNDYF